jgi:GTP-binding protein
MAVEVLEAEFIKTATREAEWPAPRGPEFAFVGRSNVGKSSMLNSLTRKKGLARVSGTPGRTRALQFFGIKVRPSPAASPVALTFGDLPGYGYAKVSKAERKGWAEMIEGYLRDRRPLRAVVLIVDSRHEPSPDDQDAAGFLASLGRPVLIAATKVDKIAKNRRFGAIQTLERILGTGPGSAIPFSAVDGTGWDAIWRKLLSLA